MNRAAFSETEIPQTHRKGVGGDGKGGGQRGIAVEDPQQVGVCHPPLGRQVHQELQDGHAVPGGPKPPPQLLRPRSQWVWRVLAYLELRLGCSSIQLGGRCITGEGVATFGDPMLGTCQLSSLTLVIQEAGDDLGVQGPLERVKASHQLQAVELAALGDQTLLLHWRVAVLTSSSRDPGRAALPCLDGRGGEAEDLGTLLRRQRMVEKIHDGLEVVALAAMVGLVDHQQGKVGHAQVTGGQCVLGGASRAAQHILLGHLGPPGLVGPLVETPAAPDCLLGICGNPNTAGMLLDVGRLLADQLAGRSQEQAGLSGAVLGEVLPSHRLSDQQGRDQRLPRPRAQKAKDVAASRRTLVGVEVTSSDRTNKRNSLLARLV